MTARLRAPLLVLLGALGYLLVFRRYGFQVEDEGTLLFQLDRVLRGQVPYLDFHTGYTPGFFYGGAGVLAWLGRSALAIRTALVVVNALSAAGLYLVARRLVGPWMAALPPLVWLLFVPCYPGEFHAFNVPYPTWPATLAWIVVALALLDWESRDRLGALAVAGLGAALALALRPDAGAFALAAATWVVAALARRASALDRLAAGTASACMALGVWFAFDFRVLGMDAAVHLLPVLAVAVAYASPCAAGRTDQSCTRTVVALAVLAAAFLVPTALWMLRFHALLGTETFLREVLLVGADYATLYYTGHPTPELLALGVVGAALAAAGLGHLVRRGTLAPTPLAGAAVAAAAGLAWLLSTAVMPEGPAASVLFQLENALFWLTPLAHLGAFALLVRTHPWRRQAPRSRALAVLVPLAVAMYLQLFPRSDFMHQITAAPLSLVLAATLLDRVCSWWEEGRWPSRATGRRAVRGALLAVVALTVAARLSLTMPGPLGAWMDDAGDPTSPPALPVRLEPGATDDLEAVRRTADFLQRNTAPEEPVWAFPATSGILFVAGRTSPLPHDYWFPGRPDHAAEGAMLTTLQRDPPRYLVTLNTGWTFFRGAPAYFANARARATSSYRLAARFGRYDVLAHATVPPAGAIARFQPAGSMDDTLEPQLAHRRQAARRWMAGLTPDEAAKAALPDDPRQAVLLLRALRDGGDLRAAAWIVAGYASPHARVRREATIAAAYLAERAELDRLRWANDFAPRAYAPYLQPIVPRIRNMLGDADASAFARAVLAVLDASG